jgi:hypothetical protein
MLARLFFLVLAALSSFVANADPIELDPIFVKGIQDGTPADVLIADPVIPPRSGPTHSNSSSGTIQKSISDDLPLPVTGVGRPGNAAQFRGLGRSAEDTDVQTLGVPLNPAQGGGFDLSVFPQYLWAGFGYQAGPALGTFDPRGTAGTLTLLPWTACALRECPSNQPNEDALLRGTAFYSTAHLAQLSAAASDRESIAVVAGQSIGDSSGPSLGLSAKRAPVTFHLLFSDLDSKTPGPGEVTPLAHQRNIRAIPLVQVELPTPGNGILKSSFFYDWNYLRYDDPSFSALPQSQDRVRQAGTETAVLVGPWRLGLGARRIWYETLGQMPLAETAGQLQASRLCEVGSLVIEPLVRAVGVSGYGLSPEVSLGARKDVPGSSGRSIFARAGLSRHFPSLLNRYYSYEGFPGYPGFKGNPGLRPERDWTGTVGGEWTGTNWRVLVQGYGQIAENAQVRTQVDSSTDSLGNEGQARIGALLVTGQATLGKWWDARVSTTGSHSRVTDTGLEFAGLPHWLGVGTLAVHGLGAEGERRWESRAVFRASSSFVGDSAGNRLSGYGELNLEADARIGRSWQATLRVENALDRRIELVRGYPSLGTTLAVSVAGEL